MGISVMYDFRADPDLGIGKIAIRRILCAYDGCLETLNSVWKIETIDKEQNIYITSDRCELNCFLESLNDCRVVNLETRKNDEIDDSDLAKEILHEIESRMSVKIMKNKYGEMRTDDPAKD